MTGSARAWQTLLLPLICALMWALPVRSAHATVTCTTTMTNVNFGNVDLVNGLNLTAAGTLTYTCSNTNKNAQYVNVCFNVGNGAQGGGNFNPRVMTSGANVLQFQLYAPTVSTIWGNATSPSQYSVQLTVPGKSRGSNGMTGLLTVPVQGILVSGQTAPPGAYSDAFTGVNTSITLKSNKNAVPATCGTASSGTFAFTVSASVVKSCTVGAGVSSNINLGTVPSTATNIAGTNTISVSCTSTTPYYIGLTPSNASTTGAGTMSGTGGNTDKVPYQLYSNAGLSTPWGNTGTYATPSNGVSGSGTGSAQSIPVYAKAPSADYTPDSYSDTVTVNVNY